MKCDYLNGWILKYGHIRKNLTQNGDPRYIVGNVEEEKKKKKKKKKKKRKKKKKKIKKKKKEKKKKKK